MREAVRLVMDYACAWSGHRLWYCYNDAPRPIQRLWLWSQGPWS